MATTTNLLIATFDSLGAAYAAADRIAGEGLLLMELFPLGSRGHFVFESAQSLQSQKQVLEKDFADSLGSVQLIENCSMKVVDAYLSKDLSTPQEAIAVFESESIGDLFTVANEADRSGLGILDLRLLRGASASAYLILTGSPSAVKSLAEKPKDGVRAQFLSKPSATIRELFEIKP